LSDIVFTPDGQNVVAAATPGGIRAWDVSTGKLEYERGLTAAPRKSWPLKSVAVSSGGRLYAAPAREDPTLLRVWDVRSNKEVASLRGHEARIRVVAFSPDGRRLASASPAFPQWTALTAGFMASPLGQGP